MQIREATDTDWDEIWPIFEAVVKAQETYAFDPDMPEQVARSIWMEQPPGRTTVAVEDAPAAAGRHGRVLGSAKMGPNRSGPGAHIGTASFMVEPAARGLGVGRALAEDMIEWQRGRGFHGIQFNAVVETNDAAVRLWRALGFRVIGTVPEAFRHPVHGLVGLHVMYLPLAGGATGESMSPVTPGN
ncbi:GNAT family N-acetyltransferase [Nocardioides mesophilus]|uniref:GNAT family N-acetyltransferase n=1 Tax=Nocardioides mesophilus TaxID=433659 RepID=A0A7G9R7Q4_9ACTN|nr:GNAT family N-acetyltransferase [Nocardioides mesophilus]QNN51629.1 GNAT family N-acetyltransferase [Nocardioides mesophilus]